MSSWRKIVHPAQYVDSQCGNSAVSRSPRVATVSQSPGDFPFHVCSPFFFHTNIPPRRASRAHSSSHVHVGTFAQRSFSGAIQSLPSSHHVTSPPLPLVTLSPPWLNKKGQK